MLHKLYYLSETRTSYDNWYIVLVLNSYHKKGHRYSGHSLDWMYWNFTWFTKCHSRRWRFFLNLFF